jgi:RNA polymerase sigma-70 factor, ECF subfamily
MSVALSLTQMPSLAETRAMPLTPPRTLEALYAAHATTVWRWVRRLTGSPVDVDDLVQEVFLQAHRSLPGFRGASQEATWLYRITARVVSRHRRARHASAKREGESTATPAAAPPTPEDQVQGAQAEALLYRALDGLNDRQRALLIAFELEELSGPQIAEALGIKQSTLWVQLHRARAALHEELEKLDAH